MARVCAATRFTGRHPHGRKARGRRVARRANMADENQGPPGGVAAQLTSRDGRGDEAVKFYQDALGAREAMRHLADDGKRNMHAHLTVNGGSLMLNDDFPSSVTAAIQTRPEGSRCTCRFPMPTQCGTRPWRPGPMSGSRSR